MRLIDADDFIKILLSVKRINKGFPLLDDDPEINNYDVGQEETFDLVIRKLSEQPTIYDIEKVVEQLEQQIKQYYARAGQYEKRGAEIEYRRMFSKACSYEHAVKIVKGGGVNDD